MISQKQSISNMRFWTVYNDPIEKPYPLTILSAAEAPAALKNESINEVLNNLLLYIHSKSPREAGQIQDDENITERMQVVITVSYLLEKAELHQWPLVRYQNSFYLFTGSYWQKIHEDILRNFLGTAAQRIGIHTLVAKHYGFRDHLIKQFRSDAFFESPSQELGVTKINLANGTFVITPNTRYLKPHDKDDFMLYKLSFSYDVNATCPKFLSYLERVLPDINKQKVLAEFLGYVFLKNNVLKLEKGLILYGSGANGKSVFFDIVLKLLGTDNVSNYTLQSLTDSSGYTRSLLPGKLLNYASEISSKMNPTMFKMLISGEPVEARMIYDKPFLLQDYCKFIFNTNVLPKDIEQNDGFFRRFLIIHFDQQINDEEKNPNLASEITETELPGILNWVLEGLDRVLIHKGFSNCDAIDAAVAEYRKLSDSVALFLEDGMFEPSLDDQKSLKDVFAIYKLFCQSGNYSACSERTFSDRLRSHGYEVVRKSSGRFVGIHKNNKF
jgi:putative DNA primase/helicase